MATEISTYLPKKVLTNREMGSWNVPINKEGKDLKTLKAEDIYTKLGIAERHIASGEENILTMGIASARKLVAYGENVDFVFFSTSYPNGEDNALKLIDNLGLKPKGYLNVHAACSGFAFGSNKMAQDSSYFDGKSILFVTSELYTPTLPDLRKIKDPPLSQTIFSDGSAATKWVQGKDWTVLSYKNYWFPEKVSNCLRMPINPDLIEGPAITVPVPVSSDNFFWMDGPAVYETMVEPVSRLILETIKEAELEPEDIDLVVSHQASRPMLEGIAKRLPEDIRSKIYRDLYCGNFSSASMPKALKLALREGTVKKGSKVVFAGFGAGLFASASVVQLNLS